MRGVDIFIGISFVGWVYKKMIFKEERLSAMGKTSTSCLGVLALAGLVFSVFCVFFPLAAQPSRVVALAAGYDFSLALMADGTVRAWGGNGRGQLGLGTWDYEDKHSLPVRIPGLSGIVAIAAGAGHVLALSEDGTVWVWGDNSFGQLGLGETDQRPPYCRSKPQRVAGLTDIVAVAAGEGHSLALRQDGVLFTWGLNSAGELGDGTSGSGNLRPLPTPVRLPKVASMAAGSRHTVVLTRHGEVFTFGSNSRGQLGDGRGGIYFHRSSPYKVSGLSGVIAVAAGRTMSLFLLADGTVRATGLFNTEAEIFSVTPTRVEGLPPVAALFCGPMAGHVLALGNDGNLWAWGLNEHGELGVGTINPVGSAILGRGKYPPVRISGFGNIVAITMGGHHTLALESDGTVWAWGDNWNCQLGLGTKSAAEPNPCRVKIE